MSLDEIGMGELSVGGLIVIVIAALVRVIVILIDRAWNRVESRRSPGASGSGDRHLRPAWAIEPVRQIADIHEVVHHRDEDGSYKIWKPADLMKTQQTIVEIQRSQTEILRELKRLITEMREDTRRTTS